MLLAVDIGNSAIKFGLFEGENLTSKFSIPTKRQSTPDEIGSAVASIKAADVEAVIICSVVPEVDETIAAFVLQATGVDPRFVDNSFDFGLAVEYEPLDSLGTDRLVAAFAAAEKYGAPCIVCSLGTATTIDVVSADRKFVGGIIAPGMDAMAEALHLKAPRLPTVDIVKPEKVIANATDDAIKSGIYHGYVAMVEGLINRIRSESWVTRVVGTGGNAGRLSAEFAGIMTVDENLVLIGLRILGKR